MLILYPFITCAFLLRIIRCYLSKISYKFFSFSFQNFGDERILKNTSIIHLSQKIDTEILFQTEIFLDEITAL